MKIGNVTNTIKILKKYQLHTKKRFGQNFLVDENTLQAIIKNANVLKTDTIVEIGIGIGALTQLLVQNAKFVYGFEIDKSLSNYYEQELDYDNLQVIFADFLSVDLATVLPDKHYKLVANLPYYITTPILFKIAESSLDFYEIYVMMQKEVGERIASNPNSKKYNALSVILQAQYDIAIVMHVKKDVFIPAPNVDSMVVKLVKKSITTIDDLEFFKQFVHNCFKFKRKNLSNNLLSYDKALLKDILAEVGYTMQDRAEKITVTDFIFIANKYRRMRNER